MISKTDMKSPRGVQCFSLEPAGTRDSFAVDQDSTWCKTGLNECEIPLCITHTHTHTHRNTSTHKHKRCDFQMVCASIHQVNKASTIQLRFFLPWPLPCSVAKATIVSAGLLGSPPQYRWQKGAIGDGKYDHSFRWIIQASSKSQLESCLWQLSSA